MWAVLVPRSALSSPAYCRNLIGAAARWTFGEWATASLDHPLATEFCMTEKRLPVKWANRSTLPKPIASQRGALPASPVSNPNVRWNCVVSRKRLAVLNHPSQLEPDRFVLRKCFGLFTDDSTADPVNNRKWWHWCTSFLPPSTKCTKPRCSSVIFWHLQRIRLLSSSQNEEIDHRSSDGRNALFPLLFVPPFHDQWYN